MPRSKKKMPVTRNVVSRKSKPESATVVHRFTRSSAPFSIPKAVADQGWSSAFNLTSLASSGEFTSLFDEYRFTRVELTFIVTGITTPGGTQPLMYYYPDHDDAVAPASQLIAMQIENMVVVAFTPSSPVYKVSLVPKFPLSTPDGRGTSNGWCDIAYPDQLWYGAKAWISYFNSTVYAGTFITVIAKYDCEFRSVR